MATFYRGGRFVLEVLELLLRQVFFVGEFHALDDVQVLAEGARIRRLLPLVVITSVVQNVIDFREQMALRKLVLHMAALHTQLLSQ